MAFQIGDKAPDFVSKDQNGNMVKLSDFIGKDIVLYFYPKDDTPGCTIEAKGFRDDFSEYEKNGMVIIGVSNDDEESHKKFIEKYNLPFILLTDTNADISKKYGVYVKKNLFGKESMGIHRTTFIIDKNGLIKNILTGFDCATHSREILKTYS